MIVLRSADVLVRLDPGHGAEILDFIELRTGRQLLGRPPFASSPPIAGDLDETSWTAAYRGGWQILLPNAGNACEVGGRAHGFHGRASNDPWELRALDEGAVTLVWSGHGLCATRELVLVDGGLSVSVNVTATEDRVPLVAVEHIALGLELLDPEVALELRGGRAYELDEATGPPKPPDDAGVWPEVRLLDGSTERADRWHLARPRSRLLCIADLPEGRAVVRNVPRGHGFELTWDSRVLPHAWVWHEARSYGGPWRQHAELLVIEPASVPHSLGLAAAVDHDQARWLARGESIKYSLFARPSMSVEDVRP